MTEKTDSNNSKQQYDRFTENANAQYKYVGVTPLVIRRITPFHVEWYSGASMELPILYMSILNRSDTVKNRRPFISSNIQKLS